MARFEISKFGENLPVTSIVAFSQAVIGFGTGLLVAELVRERARHKLGIGLLAGGVALLLPAIVGIAANLGSRPNSSRRVRRRLDSIRRDTGLSANGEGY